MSDRMLVTGSSEIAVRIAEALGFGEFHVRSLELVIDAAELIKVQAVIYPTREQLEALGGEIEKFREFGAVKGQVEFTYTEESDDG